MSSQPVRACLSDVLEEIEIRLESRPEEALQSLRLGLEELAHYLATDPDAEEGEEIEPRHAADAARLRNALERLRGRWRAVDDEVHRLADETESLLGDLRRADVRARRALVEAYQRDVGALD